METESGKVPGHGHGWKIPCAGMVAERKNTLFIWFHITNVRSRQNKYMQHDPAAVLILKTDSTREVNHHANQSFSREQKNPIVPAGYRVINGGWGFSSRLMLSVPANPDPESS